VLLPKGSFLNEPIVSRRGSGQHEWSNDELEGLANTYGVSEETVLRRLLTLGRTTPTFYARKRAEYLARYQRIEDQEREAVDQDEFKRNRPQEVKAAKWGEAARRIYDDATVLLSRFRTIQTYAKDCTTACAAM
jgi:Zn-dependent peptidase ImmA (M78 family)